MPHIILYNCLCWCDTFTLFMCDVFPHGLVLCSKLLVPPSPPSPPRFNQPRKLFAVSSDNFSLMSLLSTVKTNVQIIIPQPSPLLLEIVLFCICHVPLNTFSEALCRSVSFSLLFCVCPVPLNTFSEAFCRSVSFSFPFFGAN